MRAVRRFLTSAKTSWIVLVAALAVAGLVFGFGSGSSGDSAPGDGLPDSAESVRAADAAAGLPAADTTSALLAYSRGGEPVSDDDVAVVAERAESLADLSADGVVPPPTVSDDGEVALVIVPLDESSDVGAQAERADEIRSLASADLPDGLDVLLTGPEGFAVDIAAVFDGANVTLLIVTAFVVAVLLLVTYRSPWLWLVPLSVVGLADGIAGIVATRLAAVAGITLDASVKGILSVLVFGAGTNYALLLIARYRDELRLVDDRREAMSRALRGAGPAIIASGGTVVLSLLTLLFAELSGNRALGLACAAGILIAMLFALTVLPAALVLFGRGLFWPVVPRVGDIAGSDRGPWRRLGVGVSKRPALIAVIGVLVLGGLAAGGIGAHTGLAQTERFTTTPEAVEGQRLLAESFSAGSSSPTYVIADTDAADAVVEAALELDGVDSARLVDSDAGVARIDVVLSAAAETPEAFASITELREAVHAVPGAEALVGGLDAQSLDAADAQERDQALVIPLILGLVLLVLVLLLRAVVAPLLLLATVVASFFASLGAAWLLFQHVLGFPALDDSVVLFSFLFLVALGVDYNIFLVTRAKEEAALHGTRQGMIRALASTGGVITSAGILLAAVFAVLGVLPLITLTQIGIIVCIGVLLDTLLVRTVIVPSLAFLAGERFWWPSRAVTVEGELRASR